MASAPDADDAPKPVVPLVDLGELDRALRRGGESLNETVRRYRPADLGRDLSRRSTHQGQRIVEAADERRGAAILRAAHPSVAAAVIASMEPVRAGRLLSAIATEPRTAIVAAMEAGDRARLEAGLAADDRAFLDRCLALPETSVARVVSPRVWRVDVSKTVGDALDVLRDHAEQVEVAPNLYVTDGATLVGVIALRDAATMPREKLVVDAMVRAPISVHMHDDLSKAAEIINTHDFLSIPVVEEDGTLVGAVRVDDVLDAALQRAGTGALNQGAVAGKVAGREPYFHISIAKVVRSRITWLVLLFVAEMLTGTVLRAFEEELATVVALSFFVPLIIGTGGNAGSQTVSTIIRALAVGEVRTSDVGRVVAREVSAGVLLGILLAAVAFGRALMWGVGTDLAICVAITIFVVCAWANFVGSMIPLGAHALKIDPTLVSGPMITTLVDASGLFIYLSVAHFTVAALAGT